MSTQTQSIICPPSKTADPQTGREVTQLTFGDAYCYPLYFYGPAITSDSRYVIYHRYENDTIQLWKVDVETGETVQLTDLDTPDCLWRKWENPNPGRGVRELQCSFSPETEEVFYFDRNTLRAKHVHTLADREIYELPAGRVVCGIPGVSHSGTHHTLMHADAEWWNQLTPGKARNRTEPDGIKLDVVDCKAGTARTLLTVDYWISHADFMDENRIVFSHPPTEIGIMMTDLRGMWCTQLRPQTEAGWKINHCVSTKRGLMYETASPGDFGVIGLVNPDTYAYQDYRANHPIHHVGNDPEGRLFFGDYYRMDDVDVGELKTRYIGWFPRLHPDELNEFVPLTSGMHMFGTSQRSHVHPMVTPNRKHILFTGPDPQTETNHVFMVDISDLADTETEAINAPFTSC